MKIRVAGKGPGPLLDPGWVSLRALLVGNKCEAKNAMEAYRRFENHFQDAFPILPVSVEGGMNLDELRKEIYQILNILRVYTKTPGKEADRTEPVILKRGSTVEEVALSVHKDFVSKLRYAKVWGSGKFDGQRVKRNYLVNEGDVIELHI